MPVETDFRGTPPILFHAVSGEGHEQRLVERRILP